MVITSIQEQVKAHLNVSRYKHTLGVVKFAVMLAKLHGANQEHAEIAALLHDYCKYASDELIIKTLEETHLSIHPIILNKPNLDHGLMASYIVSDLFNIQNEDILNAIRHHTFGRKHMSKLEKIIYLSDSLEENRSYDGIEAIRDIAIVDLDQAVILVSENTLIYELRQGHMIHENTILMRNELMEEY